MASADWASRSSVRAAMGFNTVAINRGKDKEELARQLGAHHYIDATAQDVVAELQKLGGASVILATAPNAQAISGLVDGLAPSGKLLVPAAPLEPLINQRLLADHETQLRCRLVFRHRERFAGHAWSSVP